MIRSIIGSAACSVALALAPLAAAQTPSANDDPAARAEQSFREGRDLLAAGNNAAACSRFRESLTLFRRASTLLNLGVCSEEMGQIAAALAYWQEGAALLEANDERLGIAKQRVKELSARVPRLSVLLPPRLPAGATVELDGAVVSRESLSGMRLDPGVHNLILDTTGHQRSQLTVVLAEGDDKTEALPLGRPLWSPPPPPPPTPEPVPPAPESADHAIPVWVWPVGSVGLACGIAAIAFAVDYNVTLSRQEQACRGTLERCTPNPPGSYDPSDDNDRKFRDAVLGVSLGVGGGALLVSALIGAAIGESPDAQPPGVDASLGPGGVVVRF